jgi:hypothetical protein
MAHMLETVQTGRILMQEQYRLIIKQDGPWWIGWVKEVPGVNCQESSCKALLESLGRTLAEALELDKYSNS